MEWYKSDKLAIYFDENPHVCVRYILPSMTNQERLSIKRFPFICKTKLGVKIVDLINDKSYEFTIPKDYCYDGASIPRIFWRVIGVPTDNRFLIAALVHDTLCENHEYINNNKSLSTNVFNALLEVSGVNSFSRFLMKNSVACYQTIIGKWKNNASV